MLRFRVASVYCDARFMRGRRSYIPAHALLPGGVLGWGLFLLASGGALPGLAGGAFLGLLGAIGITLDLEDLGVVQQAVDQRRHGADIGEHLIPFGEGLVGGQEDGAALVTPADHLEEQIRGPTVIGEIAHL